MLFKGRRTASVIALTYVDVYVLQKESVDKVRSAWLWVTNREPSVLPRTVGLGGLSGVHRHYLGNC